MSGRVGPATGAREAALVQAVPRGRVLVGAFAAAHFAQHVSTSLLNPLLPPVRDAFALTYAQSGVTHSTVTLVP